jgi:peptidoglycan/LPS O-acetylase OafA/YrhL
MTSAVFGSLWFIAMAAVVAALLWAWPALARAVLGTDPPTREASLDGLRGVLALAVVLHHTLIAQAHFGGAPWQPPPSNFDNLAGQGAVALFFMTSAYLFWGRIVRLGTLDWPAFYRGRLRRLVPMYAVTVAVLLAIVAVQTQFELRVPLGSLVTQIIQWCSFALLDQSAINGFADTSSALSVTWTLRYEWLFYWSLPFFAYAYGALRRPWMLYVAVVAVGALGGFPMAIYFGAGAIAVHAVARWRDSAWARRIVSGVAVLALAGLVATAHDAYAARPALLLFPVFVAALIAAGPWIALRWAPLRFLGHISYSVYLLHNPVIYAVGAFGFGPAQFAALDTVETYGAMAGIAALTIALSTLTYLFVEKPWITGSKRAQ